MAQIPIPNCNDPDDPCTAASTIPSGRALVAINDATGRHHPIDGSGIPVKGNGKVEMRDGSKKQPIKLDAIERVKPGTPVPFLMAVLADGQLVALEPEPGPALKPLMGKGGQFAESDPFGASCFPEAEICGDCIPAYETVWTEKTKADGSKILCLARRAISNGPHFDDTNSVEVTGDGSVESPFRFNVKLSGSSGNTLSILEDGVMGACCYGNDPLADV